MKFVQGIVKIIKHWKISKLNSNLNLKQHQKYVKDNKTRGKQEPLHLHCISIVEKLNTNASFPLFLSFSLPLSIQKCKQAKDKEPLCMHDSNDIDVWSIKLALFRLFPRINCNISEACDQECMGHCWLHACVSLLDLQGKLWLFNCSFCARLLYALRTCAIYSHICTAMPPTSIRRWLEYKLDTMYA